MATRHTRQPSDVPTIKSNESPDAMTDSVDDLDSFMENFDHLTEAKRKASLPPRAPTATSAAPATQPIRIVKTDSTVSTASVADRLSQDPASPLREHPGSHLSDADTPPPTTTTHQMEVMNGRLNRSTDDGSGSARSKQHHHHQQQQLQQHGTLTMSVSLGASVREEDMGVSGGFDSARGESPAVGGSGVASGSGVSSVARKSTTTFGESAVDEELAIDWCNGTRTTYCSSRCHCFVQVLAMHQQVDCNVSAATAAKYLENLCDKCKVTTVNALVQVRRFLRCVTFIQLKFHWRFVYRRVCMERNYFLGGCSRQRYEHACSGTKGRCMRCEPFLEIMMHELLRGVAEINGESQSGSPIPGAGSVAFSKLRIRRKAQSTVEARKKLVEKALRMSYFLCARCKCISKAMLKQAAAGRLKSQQ